MNKKYDQLSDNIIFVTFGYVLLQIFGSLYGYWFSGPDGREFLNQFINVNELWPLILNLVLMFIGGMLILKKKIISLIIFSALLIINIGELIAWYDGQYPYMWLGNVILELLFFGGLLYAAFILKRRGYYQQA